jgi:hypothetical protein
MDAVKSDLEGQCDTQLRLFSTSLRLYVATSRASRARYPAGKRVQAVVHGWNALAGRIPSAAAIMIVPSRSPRVQNRPATTSPPLPATRFNHSGILQSDRQALTAAAIRLWDDTYAVQKKPFTPKRFVDFTCDV